MPVGHESFSPFFTPSPWSLWWTKTIFPHVPPSPPMADRRTIARRATLWTLQAWRSGPPWLFSRSMFLPQLRQLTQSWFVGPSWQELHRLGELLRHRSRHQPSGHIPDDDPSHSTAGLLAIILVPSTVIQHWPQVVCVFIPDKPAVAPRLKDLKFAANLCSSKEKFSSGSCPITGVGGSLGTGDRWLGSAVRQESVVSLVPHTHLQELSGPTTTPPNAPETALAAALLCRRFVLCALGGSSALCLLPSEKSWTR